MSEQKGPAADISGTGADVEMASDDSGYSDSTTETVTSQGESSESAIHPVSGDSTATSSQPEQTTISHEQTQVDNRSGKHGSSTIKKSESCLPSATKGTAQLPPKPTMSKQDGPPPDFSRNGADVEMSSVDSGYSDSTKQIMTSEGERSKSAIRHVPGNSTTTSSQPEQKTVSREHTQVDTRSGKHGSSKKDMPGSCPPAATKGTARLPQTSVTMSGDPGHMTELLGADMEISVDSGYTDSQSQTLTSQGEHFNSSISSLSEDSTSTLVQPEQSSDCHEQTLEDPGSVFPGQSTEDMSRLFLPVEAEDQSARTEKWVEESFDVFVKDFSGKTHTIPVERTMEVTAFRQKVFEHTSVPAEQQRLVCQVGQTLQDGKSLCDYEIIKHSTIYCHGRMRGG